MERGILQRQANARRCPASLRVRVGDAVGIGRGAIAEQFAVDLGSTPLGMLQFLQHHHRRSLTEHKPIAVAIEGPAGPRRLIVAGGEGCEEVEPGHAKGMDHAVSAAGKHHIGIPTPHQLHRLADRLARGRAGSEAVEVGAVGIEHPGQMARRHVGLLLHFRERMERFQTQLGELRDVETVPLDRGHHHAGERLKILLPLAAPQIDTQPGRIMREPLRQAGIAHRLQRRSGGKSGVPSAVLPAGGILSFIADVPVANLGGDPGGKPRRIEDGRQADAGGTSHEIAPQLLHPHAQRRDAAHPGDHHPASATAHRVCLQVTCG